ncbi:MAG: peptidase [Friedmanniella sp.]|nr:peptidase [Friedmanniella sp.]
MSLGLAVGGLGAGVCVGAAVLLAPWARRLSGRESRWLRTSLVVPLAGLGGLGAAFLAGGWPELAGSLVLVVGCAWLVLVDLADHRLPDRLLVPLYPLLLLALVVAAATSGSWERLGRAGAAAAVLLAGSFVLALVQPDNLGLGDVKLFGLLGGFLGWFGWAEVTLGALAAFALNALVALLLVLTRRVSLRGELPFGPWLVAGAVVGVAFGPAVLGA